MKVQGWLQIVPVTRGTSGQVTKASIERVTQSPPKDPLPAAIVLVVTIDVPDSTWDPLYAEGALPEGAKLVPFKIELPPDPEPEADE